MVEALDERKLEILRFLARRVSRCEGSPSIREIGAAVGLKSTQSVHAKLGRLADYGYVERGDGRHRSVRLTEKGWEAAGEVPLMGRIAAGRGLEAVAVNDEAYSLAAELLGSRSGRRRSGRTRWSPRRRGRRSGTRGPLPCVLPTPGASQEPRRASLQRAGPGTRYRGRAGSVRAGSSG